MYVFLKEQNYQAKVQIIKRSKTWVAKEWKTFIHIESTHKIIKHASKASHQAIPTWLSLKHKMTSGSM
jgi:hypothetical protein